MSSNENNRDNKDAPPPAAPIESKLASVVPAATPPAEWQDAQKLILSRTPSSSISALGPDGPANLSGASVHSSIDEGLAFELADFKEFVQFRPRSSTLWSSWSPRADPASAVAQGILLNQPFTPLPFILPRRTRTLSESQKSLQEDQGRTTASLKFLGSSGSLLSSMGGDQRCGSSTHSSSTGEDHKAVDKNELNNTMSSRGKQGCQAAEPRNLSFGISENMVYDIDGKFPYTYYESKPVLYDLDGVHRYKHFQAFKPTPYTEAAPHHEKSKLGNIKQYGPV